MKKNQQGFTLIELMIVVAIIGILAAVAIPAYQEYVGVSHGGAAGKAINPYVSQGQICIQTGVKCDTVVTNAALGITFNPSPAVQDTALVVTLDEGDCTVTYNLDAAGQIGVVTAASSGTGATTAQCEKGALGS